MANQADIHNAIAVIGLSGRFPKSLNIDQYWSNLKTGNVCITFFSDEELRSAGVPADLLCNPAYVKASGFLERADLFDAEFFNFTPREAEVTDPQHRLFLECAWEALEVAGYDPSTCPDKTGVFGGCSFNSYLITNLLPNADVRKSIDSAQLLLSNDKDHLCTRVSYKLNLTGPSVTIQTSCSTSLVCVHFACQSLLNHECDIALAGGASIRVSQNQGYLYETGGIASPDGCCRAFDEHAEGTVSGNGVGIVVLKRLEEALLDRDTVHAVLRGSAVNNDGAAKVGYTAPSEKGQSEVIAEALAVANLRPADISYVETHGTGTKLGDPIEIAALKTVFGKTSAGQVCPIGSVKPSIGHLDAAAGIAGLIKVILALKHRVVPQSIYFQHGNPEINFATTPFYVSTHSSVWDHAPYPRRASVSSFGVGGTNTHVVLEEAPCQEPSRPSSRPHVLLMSARTASALDQSCHDLAEHLKQHPELDLADVAYTRATGRRHFAQRRVICCEGREEAISALDSISPSDGVRGGSQEGGNGLMFMFSLPAESCAAVGRGLFEHEAVFRRHAEPHLDLLKNIVGAEFDPHSGLMSPAVLFVVEYALARTLIDWGVKPAAMSGDHLGEYVAACLGGVFTVEEALHIIASATEPRLLATLADRFQWIVPKPLQIPYFSTTMGIWNKAGDCPDLQYWRQQAQRDQEICRSAKEAVGEANQIRVIFGSSEAVRTFGNKGISVLVGGDPRSDLHQLTRAVGKVWTAGINVDWQNYYSGEKRRRVPLPTYPFERRSYWINPPSSVAPQGRYCHEDEVDPDLAQSRDGQRGVLRGKIGVVWYELLGREAGPNDDFFEAGGDSLTGGRLIAKINHIFQLDLPSSIIFEASTISHLALIVEETLISQIQNQPS